MKTLIAILITSFTLALVGCASKTSQPEQILKAAQYNVQLGLAYLQQGNTERAKQKLDLAMQEAPQHPVVLDAFGYYYEYTHQNKLADTFYRRALAANPNLPAAQNNYGAFLCRMHKYQEAEKYLLKAANSSSYLGNANSFTNAGLCALSAGDERHAKTYFDKALQLNPNQKIAKSALQQLASPLNLENRKHELA